jgi:hypothetical protein
MMSMAWVRAVPPAAHPQLNSTEAIMPSLFSVCSVRSYNVIGSIARGKTKKILRLGKFISGGELNRKAAEGAEVNASKVEE